MQKEEHEKLVISVRDEIQTYVSKWMVEQWPDFGKNWSKEVDKYEEKIKNLHSKCEQMNTEFEIKYTNFSSQFKKEIESFLNKKHPVFQEVIKIKETLNCLTIEYKQKIASFDESVEKILKKKEELADFLKNVNPKISLYEDIYNLKDSVDCLSKQFANFRNALSSAFSEQSNPLYPLDTKIEKLGFSTRTLNVLLNANIDTVEKLINFEERHLLKFRNFGIKGYEEVMKFKEKYYK